MFELMVALQCTRGGKCPARATFPLFFDRRDSIMVSPVMSVRDVGIADMSAGTTSHVERELVLYLFFSFEYVRGVRGRTVLRGTNVPLLKLVPIAS
jgi:hypothetical protein